MAFKITGFPFTESHFYNGKVLKAITTLLEGIKTSLQYASLVEINIIQLIQFC
jgi:hypothetical protein